MRVLAGDIVDCFLGKTLYSHNWVPANLMLRLTPMMELASHPGGVEIFLVASCYRNRDKLLSDGPLGSYANLNFLH